jgi:serpin B
MDRREVPAVSGALVAAALAGCTAGEETPGGTGTRTGTPTETPTGTPKEEPPTGEPSATDARLAELAAGNAAFALDLHEHLAAEDGGNLFLSPYSVSSALAMVYAGAKGPTREQMREALAFTLDEEIHPAFADLRAALESRETITDPVGEEEEEVDAFQLRVANALWGREDVTFAEDYLALVDEHYGAGLRRADFVGDPGGERERINRWVADNTGDRIEELLPPGAVDPCTVLVLTNAIYFAASWLHEFDPADTEDGTFTALDGAESTVPFMHQDVRTNYASLPRAEAIELPYVGEAVSMVLLLPDEGAFRAFERDLDDDRLFGIFEELGDAKGHLALPRFEFETSVQLSEALGALGMGDAFDPEADFDGMLAGDGGDLWIDEVYHEAFVSVDEEGTEVAASTAVMMIESTPPEWGELRFDRPFLFCVRDRPTDAVLFLGRVTDAGGAHGE